MRRKRRRLLTSKPRQRNMSDDKELKREWGSKGWLSVALCCFLWSCLFFRGLLICLVELSPRVFAPVQYESMQSSPVFRQWNICGKGKSWHLKLQHEVKMKKKASSFLQRHHVSFPQDTILFPWKISDIWQGLNMKDISVIYFNPTRSWRLAKASIPWCR